MKPIRDDQIRKLTAMVQAGGVGASESKRRKFMLYARRLAFRLAEEIKLPRKAYKISLDHRALGRSGEVTLRSKELELLLSADLVVAGQPRVYFRRAKGGVINAAIGNSWFPWQDFATDFAAVLGRLAPST